MCLIGLIQNEEDETVKLVESLVRDDIHGNRIILITVPMCGNSTRPLD